MSQRLANALGLYMDGIRDGRVREAVTKYTGDRYTQHSTGVADGVEGFVAFFEPFVQRMTDRDLKVVRSIEDGRYVFCHVSQDLNRGEARWITTDLFDTDEEGKIVEHWDVIAPWNEESEVDGCTEVIDLERTEGNKACVEAFVTEVLIGSEDGVPRFVAEDLIQHQADVAGGWSAWRTHLDAERIQYRELFRLIGQGNFVVTYSKVDVGDSPHAVFDVYRLDGGRIVERWTNAEPVPTEPGNSGKF